MQCDPIMAECVLVYILGYNYFTPSGFHIGIHFFGDLINPVGMKYL